MLLIVLKDVSKTFKNKSVLKNISLHVAKKEHVGLIGLNGAGKTTLLNVIAGVIKPDAGFIRTGGKESIIEDHQSLRELVYLSGTRSQLWEELTVKASLQNCMSMYQIDPHVFARRLEQLQEIFETGAFMDLRPGNLSLGERMRCELVYALLAEPQILLLDEVLIGVDVSIKHKIIQFFEADGKEKQATIIYTSNHLAEVEKLCDRVILLHEGEIIFDGKAERMICEFSPYYRMEVRIVEGLPDLEDLPLEKYRIESDRITIDYDKQKIETTQILKHLMKKSKIGDIRLYEPDLEGTIKKIYGGREWKTS
ncbi:MAG: ATP-binding cassette domain-containing protein [Lachnospiraceae bacterium]|nr:ATP-binding cassette domain-containing protein [Lachnospiraceae bacterium]MBD5483338.1 ATP-binding cassette domain-containing protein [Lachnospiraceae bacterium]